MEKHGLKEFVQIIQNKISIAAAVAVLKSKPIGQSARKYAEEIQEKLLQTWIKSNESSVFDDKILELQQDKIFDEITELLEHRDLPADISSVGDSSDSNQGSEKDTCEEVGWSGLQLFRAFFSESDSDSGSESDASRAIKDSANFMQAMTQLKFAVDSSKIVPVDRVNSFLYDSLWKHKSKETKEVALRTTNYSEDSGFGDSCALLPQGTSAVPSSVLRFHTHSYKTEALLRKSMSSLLKYTESLLLNKPVESFRYWKGSILEHLFCIFEETADNPLCSNALTNFVLNILEKIWISTESDKLTVWEYQLKIVSELCSTSHICADVINFLILKLMLLSSKIKEGNLYTSENSCDIHLIEKCPLFINLLVTALKKWEAERMKEGTVPAAEKIDRNITELWKKKWSEVGNNTITNDKEDSRNIVEEWKSVCNKLITSCTEQFPLLAIQMWEVNELLTLPRIDG